MTTLTEKQLASLPYIRSWLVFVAAMVFAMVIVGGATRLTDSGLSITEWQPLLGAIPPLNEADWLAALEKYRQIPEYQLINKGMSLDEFKFIYWWEWGHRFLGRAIGMVFFVPFVFFWLTGQIAQAPRPAAGWCCLSSAGCRARWAGTWSCQVWWSAPMSASTGCPPTSHWPPSSSQQSCGPHSALAMTSAGLPPDRHPGRPALALIVLIIAQTALGGFVAGLDAGLSYNTWPLMDGRFIPRA